MCGDTHDVVIYSQFNRNLFRGFGAPWGPHLPFPITLATGYLATGFYNSWYAGTTVPAVTTACTTSRDTEFACNVASVGSQTPRDES